MIGVSWEVGHVGHSGHDWEVDIDPGRLVEVVGEDGEGDVSDGLGDLLVVGYLAAEDHHQGVSVQGAAGRH